MHQRPPADPNNKDDLLVPAEGSFVTTMDRTDASPADFDAFVAPDLVDAGAVYHGGGEATEGVRGEGDGHIGTTSHGRSAVDLFDDVFGSSPESHGHGQDRVAATASSPTIPTSTSATARHHDTHSHPSDMNRLQQDHSTAGYREGLSAGKNATLQAGFDEGYSLGAALGGVVGELLGLLEALVVSGGEEETQTTTTSASADDADPLPVLLGRARHDLTAPSIFSPGYFAPDGTWIYDVEGSGSKEDNEGKDAISAASAIEVADAAAHATIFDVANAHPLIKTWRGIVDRQLERRRIRWGKAGDDTALAKALGLKDEDDDGHADNEKMADAAPTGTARAPGNSASALDW